MKRRKFLAATALSAFACPSILRASRKPDLRLGFVADPQYADIDTLGTRFYRKSIGKLSEAVEHFNRLDLDWCVNLGDLIDKHWLSFDEIFKPIERSKYPIYQVLGNHDFDLADDKKSAVPERLGMKNRYYAVENERWTFLMLDTTDISLYANRANTPEYEKAKAEFDRYTSEGNKSARPWNGAVSERQLEWFEAQCQKAAQAGRRVIVFAHHPVYPVADLNEWNSTRILELLSRNRNVVAWFNGHNHAGAFGELEGLPFITLHGMVETESTTAFSVAEIYDDRLVLAGSGREPSRELLFRAI